MVSPLHHFATGRLEVQTPQLFIWKALLAERPRWPAVCSLAQAAGFAQSHCGQLHASWQVRLLQLTPCLGNLEG